MDIHPLDQDIFSSEYSKKYYTKRFLRATYAYSSPLTRAIQTSLLALKDHRSVQSNNNTNINGNGNGNVTPRSGGIILLSNIREVKVIAGLDTGFQLFF